MNRNILCFSLLIGQFMSGNGDVISHVNITHVRAIDGGFYTCQAENQAGKIKHTAKINIYGRLKIKYIA